jgi:hypothetical protein
MHRLVRLGRTNPLQQRQHIHYACKAGPHMPQAIAKNLPRVTATDTVLCYVTPISHVLFSPTRTLSTSPVIATQQLQPLYHSFPYFTPGLKRNATNQNTELAQTTRKVLVFFMGILSEHSEGRFLKIWSYMHHLDLSTKEHMMTTSCVSAQ